MDGAGEAASGTRARVRVLICDDDPMVRQALVSYLRGADDIDIVGAVADAASAMPAIRNGAVDVLLLDVRMPGMDGVSMAAWVAEQPNPPRTVYLTSFDDERLAHDAVSGVVAGLLTKDLTPDALAHAVRAVADGMTVVAAAPLENLNVVPRVASKVLDDMSEREVEVLRLLCAGLSNAEIASKMFLSESSVKASITSLMVRLGVKNRVSLALRAVDNGIV